MYHKIADSKTPLLAVLIDPDKFNPDLVHVANHCKVHCFFVGGSQLSHGNIEKTIQGIKKISKIPVIICPGDEKQISAKADAILFLSLLSGRNPEYLIGKQIVAAPIIKRKKLECISTAYILVHGNAKSTTQKVTRTQPIKQLKQIVHTAMAAELLGFKLLYLEAGSGAKRNIQAGIIRQVKKQVSIPLLVGGGIDSVAKTRKAIRAGADLIVIGNALEKDIHLLKKVSLLF